MRAKIKKGKSRIIVHVSSLILALTVFFTQISFVSAESTVTLFSIYGQSSGKEYHENSGGDSCTIDGSQYTKISISIEGLRNSDDYASGTVTVKNTNGVVLKTVSHTATSSKYTSVADYFDISGYTEPLIVSYSWATHAEGGSSSNKDVGIIKLNVTLTKVPIPSITGQSSSFAINEKSEANMYVNAAYASAYQWQSYHATSGAWNNINGATNNTYSFTTALTDNGNKYRCLVSNGTGSVYSNTVTLTVKALLPTIIDQPNTVSAIASTEAVFTLDALYTTSYQWQLYSKENSKWENIGGATDKKYKIKVTLSDSGKKYRCVLSNSAGQTISGDILLNVKRNGYQKIIAAYYKTAEAGSDINVNDVLVALLYQSGEPDFASGWSNLYFIVTKDVITSTVENADGSKSEVVETVTEETKTYHVEYGDNEITVRLKDENATKDDDCTKEATFTVKGIDNTDPKFKDIELSDFDVINEDQEKEPVDITVTLSAEDNYTKEDELLYALKKKGEEVQESDFSTEEVYKIQVTENCTYVAHVKDSAGNITTEEIDIIIIDNEDPVIVSKSLIFKEEDGWVTRNIIQVEATDNYRPELMQYKFNLPEGAKSNMEDNNFGKWIDDKEIVIDDNGVYTIEVKDSVGNITKTTIDVKNIDGIAPEIQNIEFKALS